MKSLNKELWTGIDAQNMETRDEFGILCWSCVHCVCHCWNLF